jgi:hypothetical protein
MKEHIQDILLENAELLAEKPLDWELELQKGEVEIKMLRDRINEIETGIEEPLGDEDEETDQEVDDPNIEADADGWKPKRKARVNFSSAGKLLVGPILDMPDDCEDYYRIQDEVTGQVHKVYIYEHSFQLSPAVSIDA